MPLPGGSLALARTGWWPVRGCSVVGALRRTGPGSELVQAPDHGADLGGWALVERLLKDLAPLNQPIWLVIDDVHELGPEVLRQLQLLVCTDGIGLVGTRDWKTVVLRARQREPQGRQHPREAARGADRARALHRLPPHP
jgi:hypothetical protein